MLNLYDVKYNMVDNTYLQHKTRMKNEAVAGTSPTNILVLYHISPLYHSLFDNVLADALMKEGK